MELFDGIVRISWSWSLPDKWQLAISVILCILLIAELWRWKRANDRHAKRCYQAGYSKAVKDLQSALRRTEGIF